MAPLRICLVSSEVAPFAKTGGLADVCAALARYLQRAGHDVRVFLPFYSSIDASSGEILPVNFLRDVPMWMGPYLYTFSIHTARLPRSPLWIYLVRCPALYDRPGLYTSDRDEPLRFALLSRAAIECCQRMGWAPQVFHCNDWHTALIPAYLRTVYAWDSLFQRTRTLLTLHNVAYQGVCSTNLLGALELAEHAGILWPEDTAAGRVNFLRTGILYADLLSTVSPTHAREIQTEDYGYGLHELLRERSDRLVGILNGIDRDEWDPETDPLIPAHYSRDDLSGKEENKRALLERMHLPPHHRVPTVAVVSRFTWQKGFDIAFEPLQEFLSRLDLRLAVVGTGERRYEESFARLEGRFPGRVAYHRGFSNELAHLAEAGADIFLMPSRYEPCGLNQMYSLRYGTPPIVRKTGGLADSVQLYDRGSGEGTGFVFDHFSADALRWALGYALDVYRDPGAWAHLQRSGMAQDFSWDRQVGLYLDLYSRLAASAK